MPIPARLHFCWIGASLPWAYAFAVLSAAERSEIPEIVLHHTDRLEDGGPLRALLAAPGVRLCRLDAGACLARADEILGLRGALEALYRRLDRPVTRSDVLRAAILFLEGGIYLDLDTVTVGSLLPLTRSRNVVGSEVIVWPAAARASRSVLVLARHLSLDLLRKGLKRMPHGWMAFRRVERLYPRSVNNAVMGAEQGSAVFADYLRSMTRVAPEQQRRLYALGPRLLQEVALRHRPGRAHGRGASRPSTRCRLRFRSTGSGPSDQRACNGCCRRRRGWCTGMRPFVAGTGSPASPRTP